MKRSSISSESNAEASPALLIGATIEELDDWRDKTLATVRALIKQADPEVVEEVKWTKPSNSMRGVPEWSHAVVICTGETYKDRVKLTFAKGAALAHPAGHHNSSLEGNVRRAIDIAENDDLDAKALKALVRATVKLHSSAAGDHTAQTTSARTRRRAR